MITYFKIMVAWCCDSKCSSWERSLALSLSLQVLASSIIAACYKTDVEHYFCFLSFFFPVKSKILLDFFRLRKIGSNVGLSLKWSGIKRMLKKQEIPVLWFSENSKTAIPYIFNYFGFINVILKNQQLT